MRTPETELKKKVQSDITNRLEDSTARSFSIQMVAITVLTYLCAVTIQTLNDLLLYGFTVGGITLTGLMEHFISSSLSTFTPIALVSSILILIMIRPVYRIMKRNENGETITEDEYFKARKRSTRIPQIIFIINIIFPVIHSLVDQIILVNFGEGLVILVKDISIFILAALTQNALYQRLLSKPRAMKKIYTVDSSTKNWFVRKMDGIQLYVSVILVAAVLFHGSMTVLKYSLPKPEMPQGTETTAQQASDENMIDSFYKMRAKMQNENSPEAVIESEPIETSNTDYALLFLLLIIISMGLIKIVDTIVTRAKSTQIKILKNVLAEMAEGSGDLTQRVLIVQADEVGNISHQLNKVLNKLQSMFRNITEQTAQVAESSKAVSYVLEGTVAATEEMAASVSQINSNTSKNQKVVTSSQNSLTTMLNSLDQINTNVNTQAAFVEQTSSAITEMIANIQSVNELTTKANNVSSALKTVSDSGGQAVHNSITAVKDIEESSNEVNNLVIIISRILAATNMLAMNAAIEAAHAGDAGRGFAVVAEEVRNLADDSSSNLKTISENIKDVIDRVNRGVDLSENAGEALNEISSKTTETSRLINEVSAAMQEQAAGANEVLGSINSLVETSASINRLSEDQHQNNEIMKENLSKTINAFSEVQSATSELELGNREILNGIEELKEVIAKNESVVAELQKELGGFKI